MHAVAPDAVVLFVPSVEFEIKTVSLPGPHGAQTPPVPYFPFAQSAQTEVYPSEE